MRVRKYLQWPRNYFLKRIVEGPRVTHHGLGGPGTWRRKFYGPPYMIAKFYVIELHEINNSVLGAPYNFLHQVRGGALDRGG